jgi:hypothetical protein
MKSLLPAPCSPLPAHVLAFSPQHRYYPPSSNSSVSESVPTPVWHGTKNSISIYALCSHAFTEIASS